MPEPIRWQDAWWYQRPDGTWLRFDEGTQEWVVQRATPQPVYAVPAGMGTGAKVAIAVAITGGVLVILLILAAIAIPVFLRQREKAWIDQVEAALRNAEIAQEIHCEESPDLTQCYGDSIDDLVGVGLEYPSDVELRVAFVDGSRRFCVEGRHLMIENRIWSLDSESGEPTRGSCVP